MAGVQIEKKSFYNHGGEYRLRENDGCEAGQPKFRI
jgi:hypothetical protein